MRRGCMLQQKVCTDLVIVFLKFAILAWKICLIVYFVLVCAFTYSLYGEVVALSVYWQQRRLVFAEKIYFTAL